MCCNQCGDDSTTCVGCGFRLELADRVLIRNTESVYACEVCAFKIHGASDPCIGVAAVGERPVGMAQ